MIKIDLITGFLGSGKTTFMKRYVSHLLEQGEHIGILENDYGAVNVDMMLLQDMIGDQCDLEMVPPAYDYDCHRRRFKSKLIMMGMVGYDRVILEPSGIYDVDEFFEVLREDPLDRWFEIANVIAIVDASLEDHFTKEADYLLAAQVAKAGKIVFSKTQLSTPDEIKNTKAHLHSALEAVGVNRDLSSSIMEKDWADYNSEDYDAVAHAGYENYHHMKMTVDRDHSFQSYYYMNLKLSEEKLRTIVTSLFEDPSCGNIIRIKGFLSLEDGSWIELNATKSKMVIQPIEKGQEVFIVIGEHMNKEVIDAYWE